VLSLRGTKQSVSLWASDFKLFFITLKIASYLAMTTSKDNKSFIS
jgi:hypothetical protein